MSMFKTIGVITGGAVVGSAATMILGNKSNIMDKVEDMIRGKADEAIQDVSNKVSEIVNPNDHNKEVMNKQGETTNKVVTDEMLLEKISQIEDCISEIKSLLQYRQNSVTSEANKDTEEVQEESKEG